MEFNELEVRMKSSLLQLSYVSPGKAVSCGKVISVAQIRTGPVCLGQILDHQTQFLTYTFVKQFYDVLHIL